MGKSSPHITNGNAWRKARARVLATEDVCGICGQSVDKSLHYLDPMAPQIDHVEHVSKGGAPTARANLRLSHRSCNRERGDGEIVQQRATSRRW